MIIHGAAAAPSLLFPTRSVLNTEGWWNKKKKHTWHLGHDTIFDMFSCTKYLEAASAYSASSSLGSRSARSRLLNSSCSSAERCGRAWEVFS